MKTININDTIENYLNGSAGKAEETWLLGEMHDNKDLAREVELRYRTNQILADRSVLQLRGKLTAIEMKRRSSGTVRRTAIKVSKYAAAIAVIALISAALYFPLRHSSNNQLYQKYYTQYVSPGSVRSVSAVNNTLMINALESYQAHDYEKAIVYLEQVLSTEQNNMESVFMHGIANMEIKNYPVASGSFTRVLQQNDNLYLEDAAWYLGLCYMMNGETDKAVRQFDLISESKSRYNKDARKLAKKLN
ncbi:MAG TPA: tetratricopeptide repeat protein [Bacteroidales bacterium]|nr:tetratricopeptide repeat protein [Bacteroidales bacterium]